MNFRLCYLTVAVVLILATSCKKHIKKQIGPHTDIYMAGSVYKYYSQKDMRTKSTAIYWKNGIPVQLSDSSMDTYATGIAVNKNDIYVIGRVIHCVNCLAETSSAVYWKNGILTQLGEGLVHGIAFKGNDFYMVGSASDKNGREQAIYWKNNKVYSFGKGNLTSIYIDGDDIYMAGYILKISKTPGRIYGAMDTTYDRSPTYWKNGAPFMLNDSTGNNVNVSSIFEQDGDVYAAGSEGLQYSKAAYWKNGRTHELIYKPHPMAYVSGIAADRYGRYQACGDIYVGHNNYIAVSWENDRLRSLPLIGKNSNAKAIAMLGKDVYIVGSDENYPVYWKNGKRIGVGKDKGNITSIALVNY